MTTGSCRNFGFLLSLYQLLRVHKKLYFMTREALGGST